MIYHGTIGNLKKMLELVQKERKSTEEYNTSQHDIVNGYRYDMSNKLLRTMTCPLQLMLSYIDNVHPRKTLVRKLPLEKVGTTKMHVPLMQI